MINKIRYFLNNLDYHKKSLVILAIVLPFEYIPSYELYGLRVRLSFFIGGLVIVFALNKLFINKQKIRLSIPEYLVLIWLFWVIIRSISVNDNRAMLNITLPIIFYVLVALSIRILAKKEFIKPIVIGLFLGAFIAIAFGFYQFFANWLGAPEWLTGLRPQYSWENFGFPRLQSTALEPLYFSAYLLLPFAFLVSFIARNKEFKRPIYIALLLLMLIADLLTLSRGGLVALFVELLVLGIFYISRINARSLVYILSITIATLLVIFSVISLTSRQGNDTDLTYGKKGIDTFTTHLKNFSFFANSTNKSNDDSVSQRDRARTQAKQTITSNNSILFFGTGSGQYHTYNKDNFENPDIGEPNNIVLEHTAQFGIVGFLLFVSAGISLAIGLFKLARNSNWLVSASAIALTAYFVALFLQAQTFTGLALTHLWFAVGLALFLVQYQSEKANKNEKTP